MTSQQSPIFDFMNENAYIPEYYWDNVARNIATRTGDTLLAGDDDPYYRFKRQMFLRELNNINFREQSVLEIGPGPGGNLLEIWNHKPSRLCGADISNEMLQLCRSNLGDKEIELVKFNGTDLPFAPASFNIVITSTVLQHITDDEALKRLVKSAVGVAAGEIYIFERIGKGLRNVPSNVGRNEKYYRDLFTEAGFLHIRTKFLEYYWSSLISGFIRKVFNRAGRREGEKQTRISLSLQRMGLLLARPLDLLFPAKRGFAMMHFQKHGMSRLVQQ